MGVLGPSVVFPFFSKIDTIRDFLYSVGTYSMQTEHLNSTPVSYVVSFFF